METTMPSEMVTAPKTKKRRKGGLFRIGSSIAPTTYWLIAGFTFALVLAAWCVLSYVQINDKPIVSSLILPTPTKVASAIVRLWGEGELWPDIKISVFRISMGFFASAILAIPLGILIGAYKGVEAAQEPLIGFVRYIPVPALIPLVMVAAGIGEPAKILLIFLGTYFQMVIIVADVTRQVPHDLLSAARTLGAKPSSGFVQRFTACDDSRPDGNLPHHDWLGVDLFGHRRSGGNRFGPWLSYHESATFFAH